MLPGVLQRTKSGYAASVGGNGGFLVSLVRVSCLIDIAARERDFRNVNYQRKSVLMVVDDAGFAWLRCRRVGADRRALVNILQVLVRSDAEVLVIEKVNGLLDGRRHFAVRGVHITCDHKAAFRSDVDRPF